MLMYKQKAAYNDGMASRYQAAQTRLRKFEEAGPPPLPPQGPGHPDAAGRRAHRQAGGDLRAARAGRPDLPVRPGDLVRRPGGGARRQRHRQVALPAAARPRRHRPRPRARAGRRRAAGAGRARRRRPGSARGCGPATSRRPTTGPDLLDKTLVEILWRGDDHRAGHGPARRDEGALPLRAGRRRATSGSARSPAGSRPGSWCCCWSCPGRRCCCSTSRPTTSTWPRAEALEEGLRGVRGHGDRGDPRPLVHPVVRPVRAVPAATARWWRPPSRSGTCASCLHSSARLPRPFTQSTNSSSSVRCRRTRRPSGGAGSPALRESPVHPAAPE